MGMFTTVIHPDDGRELEIKTGDDMCKTYRLGQKVDWSIDKDWAGHGTLLDGVYYSYSDKGHDDLVIIHKHRIFKITPRQPELDIYHQDQIKLLHKKYHIFPYKRRWWKKRVWKEEKRRKNKSDNEFRHFTYQIRNLPEKEQMGAMIGFPLIHPVGYAELGARLLRDKPLTLEEEKQDKIKKEKERRDRINEYIKLVTAITKDSPVQDSINEIIKDGII